MILKLTVFGVLLLSLVSCDDDGENTSITKEGNILVSTSIANSDGHSGTAYLQLIDDLEPKSLTNSNAFPAPYHKVACLSGDDVFVLPGYSGETQLVKYTRMDGELIKSGEYTLVEQSGATGAVTKGEYLYVSCEYIAKILVLKHADMTLVKEIDISSYGVGDQNPDPAGMILRDNLLYIALNQIVGSHFPDENRPYADVLIINTDNNEVVKMITENTFGISQPTRALDPSSIFLDEKNDIYIVCLGGFGYVPGHKIGILRIKAGETEFDNSYGFDISSASIEGESNNPGYIQFVKYHKDGKLYATITIPALYGNPPDYLADRAIAPVVIDIYAKTIKTLGLPYSNSVSRGVTVYNDIVAFGLSTNSANGIYTYNTLTKEASNSTIITTEGYVPTLDTFE